MNLLPDHRVRCADCCFNHPRFCGYARERAAGTSNTVSEGCWHGCPDFSPGRPPLPDPDKKGVTHGRA